MTEATAPGTGEQKTPEQQRAALQSLAVRFEAEEKGEQAREQQGEYIPAGDASPGGQGMPDIDAGPLLAGLFGLVSEMAAARRGAHWEFSERECQELGARTSDVIDHYFPDMSMGPGGALMLSAGIIVGPRLIADRKASRQRRQETAPAGEPDQEQEQDISEQEYARRFNEENS